jgi:hypothetical protein
MGSAVLSLLLDFNLPMFQKHILIEVFILVFIGIGPFHYHRICRPISKKINRHFGGLAILRKNKIKPYVKILKNTSPECLCWFLLAFFN